MYLNRDVPSAPNTVAEDFAPIQVPWKFKQLVSNAEEFAQIECQKLKTDKNPRMPEVDFWTDVLHDLKQVMKDIEYAEKEIY